MTRTGKTVEPMGFVVERHCKYGGNSPLPEDRYRLWVEPAEERASCGGRKFWVLGFFDSKEQSDYSRAREDAGFDMHPNGSLYVCEHNGHLCE